MLDTQIYYTLLTRVEQLKDTKAKLGLAEAAKALNMDPSVLQSRLTRMAGMDIRCQQLLYRIDCHIAPTTEILS